MAVKVEIYVPVKRVFGWFVKEAFKISESDGELSKKKRRRQRFHKMRTDRLFLTVRFRAE